MPNQQSAADAVLQQRARSRRVRGVCACCALATVIVARLSCGVDMTFAVKSGTS